MTPTQICHNTFRTLPRKKASLAAFSTQEIALVHSYHQSFPEYSPTPLVALPGLAKRLQLGQILVKDESQRFGLNAFKGLGGSYAIGRLLAERLNIPPTQLQHGLLYSPEARKQMGELTFVTATDGNHGRGVAWTAKQLGQKCIVFMPKRSAEIRAQNIRSTGATCIITELNYDDTVRHAKNFAAQGGGILVQDTSWEGYEDVPRWIMQGYMTLAIEALAQMRAQGTPQPTHLFLQAGVGSFAAAVLGFMASTLKENTPTTLIVEPNLADCVFRSIQAGDGLPRAVSGDMPTLMAGLACGEPSSLGWPILRDYASAAISCPDYIAANGMRILAAPHAGDTAITAGESGAVTLGALDLLMTRAEYTSARASLGMDNSSVVLLINTEGDTSPETYRDIVWYGKYPDEACGVYS